MDGTTVVFLVAMGIFFLVFAIVIVVSVLSPKKENPKLAEWALRNDAKYEMENKALATRWKDTPFDIPNWVSDILYGRTRQYNPYTAFILMTSPGDTARLHVVTVLRLPGSVPELIVTKARKGLGAKIAKAIGEQDIELGYLAFDQRYLVQGDALFARRLLTPAVMEWLMGPGSSLIPLRFTGVDLICWTPGEKVTANLLERLELMEQFISLLPSDIWHTPSLDPPNLDPLVTDPQPIWEQPRFE